MQRFIQTLILFLALNVSAATYYVDFDAGNDANAGTLGAPFRTIPGTRNSSDTGFKQAAWNTITTSAKVAGGDTIIVKGNYGSADGGGCIYIDPSYYTDNLSSAFDQITIRTDSTFGGTNDVVLDMTGITAGIAAILIKVDGVTIKQGTGAGRIQINNCVQEGIQLKEKDIGAAQRKSWFQGIDLNSNGTAWTTYPVAAGKGQMNLRWIDGCIVTNCIADGTGSQYSNGFLFGDNGKYTLNTTFINCISRNHKGDLATDDSGLGSKLFNGTNAIIFGFLSYNNLKGMDIGEQQAAYTFQGSVGIYNSTFRSNVWGLNWNWSADPLSSTAKYRMANCIVVSNLFEGSHFYSSPWQALVAHNVYAYNGAADQDGAYSGQMQINNDKTVNGDIGGVGITMDIYNNVFYRGYECVFAGGYYNELTQVLTQKSDYNVYAQSTTDGGIFAQWGYYGPDAANVFWGSPWFVGSGSGNWFNYYGKSSTAPTAGGNGHRGSDANSTIILTGDSENSDANFWDVAYPTYRTKTKRTGFNLTTHPLWDSTYMGKDFAGNDRTRFTIGIYDLDPTAVGGGGAGGTFADNSAITINAVNQATPYPSTITVTGTASVTNVTVQIIGFSHTDPRDVEMLLVAPNGASVVLMSDGWDPTDAVSANLTFSDLGTAIPGTACVTGTYAPTDTAPTGDIYGSPAPAAPFGTTLAALLSGGVNGTWTLYIQDDSGGDAGSISGGWSLIFSAPSGGGGSTSVVTGLKPGFKF